MNATTFPRLAAISAVFEQFAFNRLSFKMVGDAAATQAGSYTGVVVYNHSDAGMTGAQIRNEEKSVTRKFWDDGETAADTKRAQIPWFSTIGGEGGVSTTFGDFHLFTEGTASAVPVVNLFVCYDVEFCQGQASGSPDLSGPTRLFLKQEGAAEILDMLARRILSPEVYEKAAKPTRLIFDVSARHNTPSAQMAELNASLSVRPVLTAAMLRK